MRDRIFVFLLLSIPGFGQNTVSFNRDIRPIMADTCFRCHGPDKSSRMANMRLDLRDEATKPNRAGRTPIVPGDPAKSQIIDRIFHSNPARLMPPPQAHKELSEKQKETLKRWVAEGANYEGHWSYQPLPAVTKSENLSQSIDRLIQARLSEAGLKPAPEADRRTLLRRLSFDLTGLPPTPAEVAAFLNDKSPNAYEKQVDRLLASPRHAEQQTMRWLDAVRYADSSGFHGDNLYPTWPYRDYVLRSFASNKSFDQFTREQIAGDLLPNATNDQKVAAAFNRLNRVSAEGGLQPKEYLAKYGADRVRTVSAVWLGATLGCAECHDHKFDPLLAKDFYSMKAFFADIKETGLVPDRGSSAWGSLLDLPTEEQAQKRSKLMTQMAAALEKLPKPDPKAKPAPVPWKFQRPLTATTQNGAVLKIYNEEEVDGLAYVSGVVNPSRQPGNGLIVASGPSPDNETYSVTFQPGAGTFTTLGLEVVQDESLLGLAVARGADRLVLSEVEASLTTNGKTKPIDFDLAFSSIPDAANEQPGMAAIDGDPATGWGPTTVSDNRNIMFSLRLATPLDASANSTITLRLRHDSERRKATLGRFRIALLDAPHPLLADASTLPVRREIAKLHYDLHYLTQAIPRVLLTESVKPEETRLMPRGNFLDETGPVVTPAIPQVFGKLDTPGRSANRLDLANWLVSKENPLSPRVFVNRLWRQFFGTGFSKVLDDLGSQGELPTHLALLDTLAAGFQSDWDVHRSVKAILMSQTYRQSSVPSKEALDKDPENRLFGRQARFRLDAENVRDAALAVSGLLTERFGGPSVRPYQPEGYLAALNFPKRDYSASRSQDQYARGVYTQWQRTFLHPSLAAFDAPSREECTVNRSSSNTPLQALVLLNDPTYVEAARAFAQSLPAAPLAQQIDWAMLKALNRKASPEEQEVLSGLYKSSLARFTANPAGAREFLSSGDKPLPAKAKLPELAAATTVTRAILNLHETITRN